VMVCCCQPVLFFSPLFSIFLLKFMMSVQNFKVIISFTTISIFFLIFLFVIFILCHFIKFYFVFLVFGSIIVICYFLKNLFSFFWFWFFVLDYLVNLIFLFNFTIQFKTLSCNLIYVFISFLVLILLIDIFCFLSFL
jgi:hypothetical protein